MEQGLKIGKGVSDLEAFKLDHLQPIELILSHNFSIILIFILGSPIPYYPREGETSMEKDIPRLETYNIRAVQFFELHRLDYFINQHLSKRVQ